MQPKFIFFDLDNTLLDHNHAEGKAHQAIYEQYPEMQQVSLENWLETYRRVNGKLWKLYQQGKIERFQVQHARFFESMHYLELPIQKSTEIGESYMQHYQDYWEWISGAEETLAEISERFDTGIITNGFKETQLKKFQKMMLGRFTDLFIISEELGKMKPHPDVFRHGEKMCGAEPEEILYIGDSYSSDIIGGKTAGWQTAWFQFEETAEVEENIADFTFTDFTQLINYLEQ